MEQMAHLCKDVQLVGVAWSWQEVVPGASDALVEGTGLHTLKVWKLSL